MSQYVTIVNFKTFEQNQVSESFNDKSLNTGVYAEIGYVLTVDLINPDKIKEKN